MKKDEQQESNAGIFGNLDEISDAFERRAEQERSEQQQRLDRQLASYGSLTKQLDTAMDQYVELSKQLHEKPEVILEESWWMGILAVHSEQRRIIEGLIQSTAVFIYRQFDTSYGKVAEASNVSRALIPKWIEKAERSEESQNLES